MKKTLLLLCLLLGSIYFCEGQVVSLKEYQLVDSSNVKTIQKTVVSDTCNEIVAFPAGQPFGVTDSCVFYSQSIDDGEFPLYSMKCMNLKDQSLHICDTTAINRFFYNHDTIYYVKDSYLIKRCCKNPSSLQREHLSDMPVIDYCILDNPSDILLALYNEKANCVAIEFKKNGKTHFSHTEKIIKEETEGKFVNISKCGNKFLILVQYTLYLYDNDTNQMTLLTKDCEDAEIDNNGYVFIKPVTSCDSIETIQIYVIRNNKLTLVTSLSGKSLTIKEVEVNNKRNVFILDDNSKDVILIENGRALKKQSLSLFSNCHSWIYLKDDVFYIKDSLSKDKSSYRCS